MTFRRLPPLMLLALLVSGVIASRQRSVTTHDVVYFDSPDSEIVAVEQPSIPLRSVAALPLPAAPTGSLRALPDEPVPALAAEPSALLAEQISLQLLAQDTGLNLTSRQWADFAATTLHHQAIRHAYEASVAVAVDTAGRRLEIPAYPVAGDALREKFFSALREKLGGEVTGEIESRLGSALEGYFAGFGVGVQTLDFAVDAEAGESGYRVTRTIRYWNSVSAENRLTTRREMHFPELEDPSGFTWGPLLSVVAAHASARNGG